MPRFANYGALDDVPLNDDQDSTIVGFRSRLPASSLPIGVASYLENVRCDRGTAKVRKGAKGLLTDITLDTSPLTLDFSLAADVLVTSITRSSTTATVTMSVPHGASSGALINIRGATQSQYNGDFLITVTDSTHFTFTVSGSPATPATGTIYYNAGPILSAVYTDSVSASCDYVDTSGVSGIVLATTGKAYLYQEDQPTDVLDYPTGETVNIADNPSMVQALGKVYIFRGNSKVVMMWDRDPTHDFVLVPTGAHPAGGTLIRMPQVEWGVQFGRRLILPYALDQAILSDLGDADTYDTVYEQLRFIQGMSDYFVGAHPHQEEKAILLCRRSIHLLLLDSSDLSIAALQEITREIGCVSRKTVATCGDSVMWLSDLGVVRMPIADELSLKLAQKPLSEPIQDIIETINWEAVSGAVGKYWNNRYYLAIPTGTNTTNDTLLVFNLLNQEWESRDTFATDFDMQNLVVAVYKGRERLHAVTTYGFVYLLEELEVDQFGPIGNVMTRQIPAKIYTREYFANTEGEKRFTQIEMDSSVATGDAYSVSLVAKNPDTSRPILSVVANSTTDTFDRPRVRQLGKSALIQINTSAGRPEFRSVTVKASTTDRNFYGRK